MKTDKASGWRSSWIVGAVAIAVVVMGGVRVWKFVNPPPLAETALDRFFKGLASDPESIDMGKKAAAEAVRVLGATGGSVVLVLPEIETQHRESYGAAYETGFRDGLKGHDSVNLQGIYFASPPCPENLYTDCRAPTHARMQDVRKEYPKVSMIVSFLGLPQFSASEQQEWLTSNPPKMVVVDLWGIQPASPPAPGIVDGLIPRR